MVLMGIDPGSVSGAYAIIVQYPDGGAHVRVDDLPVVDKMVDGAAFSRIVRENNVNVAVIEQVSAMPKQGARSGFRFGMGTGILHGVTLGVNVPLHLVTPAKWKAHYRLTSDKEKARALAIRMYPHVSGLTRVKDHGRAEALLLASYLRDVILR